MVEVCNQSTSIKVIHFAIEILEEFFVEIENTTISRVTVCCRFVRKYLLMLIGNEMKFFFLC